MNNGNAFDSTLWGVLAREQLVDLSQFHKPRFFDEVPLFSRDADLAFLKGITRNRANAILLGFALKYLKSIVSYEDHRSPYFAAVTLWNEPEADWEVPNLFVWSGPTGRLRKALKLDAVVTPFGKRIARLVASKKAWKGFEVLEDTLTDPDTSRVFISFSVPPYPSFVRLAEFLRSASQVIRT